MLVTALLSLAVPLPPQEAEAPSLRGPITAYRLDNIETLDGDPIKGGVIVVREGVIEKIGAAVVVPEQAKLIDLRGTGATAMPPLVLASSSMLQTDSRGRGNFAKWTAAASLWLHEDSWQDALEAGVVMMGIEPPGSGISGRTSVLDVNHGWPTASPLVSDLHLKLTIDASKSAKDLLRNAFESADKALEKEEAAKKSWEQARKEWKERQDKKAAEEKAAKEKSENSDKAVAKDDKEGKKEEDPEPPKEFVAPEISDSVIPFIELLNKERVAMVHINTPAEWLHWIDVLGDREIAWEAVLDFGNTTNLHEVADLIAESGVRVYATTRISYLPSTRVRINLCAELLDAGVEKLVLLTDFDTPRGLAQWRVRLADLVREGVPRHTALKAISIDAALALGQEERIQSLKAGSPANFIIIGGDPLDPVAQTTHVIYDGKIIYDREKEESK